MSFTRWFGTIIKYMTQVTFTPGADDFGAVHAMAAVGFASDTVSDGFGKAWPPTS